MSRFTAIIYTPQELNHSSNMQTGLFELEKAGFLKVKVKLSVKKRLGRLVVDEQANVIKNNKPHPKTSYYKLIDHHTQRTILFATDLYDFANHFSLAALEECDYLFKRSYESRYVKQLPARYQPKIYKYGLNFVVRSDFYRNEKLFLLGLMLANLHVNFKIDSFLFKRLEKTYQAQINHWNFIQTTRSLKRFENYEPTQNNMILFQTRCFLREDQQDVINIHQQRYHVIKLLRQHFPQQFMGGFIPSKISKEKYADALSNVPSDPEKYLDVLKSAKIVIYTRGLAYSPAWKMAEYLSQAKVIIAEKLTTELPKPLIHGKHLLYFDTDEELIENVQRVIEDASLANELAKNARWYFEENVHPKQNTRRILELMIDKLENSI